MIFFQFIFQDWNANKGNSKGRLFLFFFRIANFCATRKIYFYIGLPYLMLYKLIIQWLFTLEIPWNVKIGKGLAIYHGQAIVLNNTVTIGQNCILRHCTTIGVKQNVDGTPSMAPILGNNVDVGNNVCIIGNITIGNNAKIGSGSVVVKSVPNDSIVAGNPAIQIRKSKAL